MTPMTGKCQQMARNKKLKRYASALNNQVEVPLFSNEKGYKNGMWDNSNNIHTIHSISRGNNKNI